MTRRAVLTIALAVVAFGVACDFEHPAAASEAWTLASRPTDGERDVARAERIVVVLDRLVLPRSVNPASVRVVSGAVQAATRVRFMPVQRQVWVDLELPLDAETTHLLQLDGLVDLDRAQLPDPYLARFRTGLELGTSPPVEGVPAETALELLHRRCATAGCHAGATPALGLDLTDAAAIERTAIGAPSRFAPGSLPDEDVRGAFTLAGLPIIDVVAGRGQAATSLLVYKLLGDEHVPGEPMPPDSDPLTRAELELLSAWIEAGAPAR